MSKPGGVTAQEYADTQNLYAYYNLCSDMGDAEGYASCFTEDGVLRIEPLNLTVKGRQDLMDFKRKDREGRGGVYRRHWNGGLYIEKLDSNTTRGCCYLQAFNGKPGSLPVLSDCGVYEDTIVNVTGEWKFGKRNLTLDVGTWSPPPASFALHR